MSETIKLSWPATREFWQLDVLYEDPHLLALDKPGSLLTSPDRCEPQRPSLMTLLHHGLERGAAWAQRRHLAYLANAHRLDFETTGVILLAKDRATLTHLADQFGAEKPCMTYVALVQGTPPEEAFEIEAKLAPHPVHPGRMRVDPNAGKKAITRFALRERFAGYTLLTCRPLTARAHQIRVHLRRARLPMVGDLLYGGPPLLLSRLKPAYRFKPGETEHPLIGRTALHAEQLEITHPATSAFVTISAPWPKDLTVAVKYLRRFARIGPEPGVPAGEIP